MFTKLDDNRLIVAIHPNLELGEEIAIGDKLQFEIPIPVKWLPGTKIGEVTGFTEKMMEDENGEFRWMKCICTKTSLSVFGIKIYTQHIDLPIELWGEKIVKIIKNRKK